MGMGNENLCVAVDCKSENLSKLADSVEIKACDILNGVVSIYSKLFTGTQETKGNAPVSNGASILMSIKRTDETLAQVLHALATIEDNL
ncbi:hypothetical protein Cpap_1520 [Ruminiclostridium papyrosolvens DSM 2782]|uniref:Uncharacterized protein n=1 Tax=Ruminiclostridium papyrosolvens DSM 2782 TaxID=588581 RepID=F1TEG2_9FIRM|nr:hypothetical protein [Ruminiclostridium papyrosolvens]EGD47128.1 hypothetical protein Cpap_1520 [Ruminiclostridium papyrosolvens DSM 2782]WES36070.1 hypothetical protein P0092_08935 [Ruminiclostridium papyrosolvens DSM 2782]WES36168.1 hypothetical protein P0092_09435 [Ruminiclostridium papyrosolvens DSM 2782]